MARIRTIKPEFWGDEKLAPCAPLTRLVFLGLISMADDTGRMVDNVKVIDAFIFPESSETCRGALDELSGMGRIRRGKTTSGQRVIEIVNWSAHQKIDKPNFKASLPQLIDVQEFADFPRDVVDASSNGRGNVVDVSALHTYDLRPTTSIPTTDDPLPIDAKKPRRSAPELRKDDPPKPERKRAAKPTTAPVENWASTFGDWWNANVGAVPYGRVGRDLKPAHALHGIRKLIAGAELYNDPQEGPPRKSFVDFAANCAFWIGLAEMPMFDADGNETIRCKRIPTKARPGAA